jgi:hypothetical protein
MGLLVSFALATVTLAVPGRTSANVSMAADGAFVVAAWSATAADGPTDIFSAVSEDAGVTFSAPVRVNATPGDARVGGEQPPRVSVVGGSMSHAGHPSVVIVWTSKGEHGTRLLSARSDDSGRAFGPSLVVPGTDAMGNRGWESTAVMKDGRVGALWLDHRDLASGALSKLMFVPLETSGEDVVSGFSRIATIAAGVCYCCKTTLTVGADGAVYAAWRHVYPGNIRDIAFTVSRDGGRTFAAPIRISEDKWAIDGCPENGPAMAIDRENRVHIIWPTLVGGAEQTLALFYAMSADGLTFTPRVRLPTRGTPRHPQLVVAPDGSLVAAWDEGGDGMRAIAVARGRQSALGRARFERTPVASVSPATYPALVATTGGVMAAWSDGSAIHVQRLP